VLDFFLKRFSNVPTFEIQSLLLAKNWILSTNGYR
jgi:hypothetical protein